MIPYSAMESDEPVQVFPWVNYGLIALNFLVFFYELALGSQGDATLNKFYLDYSLVPCEYTGHCAAYAGTPHPFWFTLFTSMFLHAGWAHILGNMLFLWVFGGHVERSMGHLRYLAFYLLCGLGASALEIATAVGSNVPGLGASGAIAGVLAAYLVLYPTSKVGTLIPISFIFIPVRLPAWVLIIGWFLLQLISGIASLGPNMGSAANGGVAYWAHVGGFLTGALLIWVFRQPESVAQLQAYHGQAARHAG
jgi:membrane associated rhomboid family serine protease